MEEKKEPWLNYLALTTVILAVCATLASFKGSSYSTLSVMSQSKAANQWSYYQSKSIKGYLYEIEKDRLEIELKRTGAADPAIQGPMQEKIAAYSTKLEKYTKEKEEIQKEAKNFEAVRDEASAHSRTFGISIIFLQISILMSSIAALMKKKPVWVMGLIFGVCGIFYFVDGFLLFLK